MSNPEKQIGKLAIWLRALRAFAFSATLVPVFVGAALAFSYQGQAAWMLLPLITICALLFHAGTNVLNDYFDFRIGIDKEYTYGSSKVLIDKLLKPRQLLIAGLSMFFIASLLGLIFVAVRGLPILIIGIIGLLGGLFYTAKPVGYKYIGLGDIMVFILMGPLMVVGSYFVLTGGYQNSVLFVSLPVGFLVTAILNANNLRDINYDMQAGIKTISIILGRSKAKIEYYALIAAAYVSVLIMVLAKILPVFSLLVFLSLPLAIKAVISLKKTSLQNTNDIAMLDVRTAQLHLIFGTLLIISIILTAL
jgi:1,4-dihydroxy-2-naphthoate octaprenyltransferase